MTTPAQRGVLWIVSPLYMDSESFLKLHAKVRSQPRLPLTFKEIQFVVVDDSAGQDAQIKSLLKLNDVEVITCPFNLGHQRAIIYALRNIHSRVGSTDLVITMDGDGEDKPEDIVNLVDQALNAEARAMGRSWIVLALRTKRKESPLFKFCYLVFRLMFFSLTGQTIRSGNFACLPATALQNLIFHPNFDLCYSSSLVRASVPVYYVPCERGVRYAGQSRMNFTRLIMHGVRMLMPFLDKIAIRALVVFATLFTAGVLASVAVVGLKLFTSTAIPGWATYCVLLLLTLSSIALGNFLVLFAVFSQSQGVSLTHIDQSHVPTRNTLKQSA